MGKKNKPMMVLGSTIIAVMSIILIYVLLISTGVIVGREYLLKIEAVDIVKVYDGKPLNQSTAGTDYWHLIQGQDLLEKNNHYLDINYESVGGGDLINAGSTEFVLVPMVKEKSTGADVTDKYNIETTKGHLVILPREIVVRTNTYQKTYDGQGIEINGKIENSSDSYYSTLLNKELVRVINEKEVALPGHEISYEVTCSISDVGSADIEVSVLNVIVEDNDNPNGEIEKIPAKNYTVVYENDVRGKIEILPIYLNVSTNSQSVLYDGASVSSTGFRLNSNLSGKLLPGHSISYINSTFNATEAGEYLDDQFDFKVVNNQGEDVSKYYGIDPNSKFGQIVINKIPLTINTNDIIKVYDGKPFSEDEMDRSYTIYGINKVPNNHEVIITFDDFTNFINVGEKENKVNVVVVDENGVDVSINYEINPGEQFGSIRIEPIQLVIETYSKEKLFDGTPMYGKDVFNEDGENYNIIQGFLLDGHELTVELNSSITQAGSPVKNNITNWRIKDQNGQVVSGNYDVDTTTYAGTLEIIKPQLVFTTKTVEFDYCGKVCKITDKIDINDPKRDACDLKIVFPENWEMPSNWDWVVESFPEETNVCDIDNEPVLKIYNRDNDQLLFDDGTGFTRNFDVVYDYGKYTIKAIPLYFETESSPEGGWLYDGEKHSIKGFHEVSGLLSNHFIDEANAEFPVITDVLRDKEDPNIIISIPNEPKYRIMSRSGEDVTANYDTSSAVFGDLKINPIVITYNGEKKLEFTKKYDGTPYNQDDLESNINYIQSNIANQLMYGHSLSVDFEKIQGYINSDEYPIEVKIYSNGNDVTKNYELPDMIKEGILIIEPLKVIITTSNFDFTYGYIPADFDQIRRDDEHLKVIYEDGTELPDYITYSVVFEKDVNNNTSVSTNGIKNNVKKITFSRNDIEINVNEFNKNVDIDQESCDYGYIIIHPIVVEINLLYENNDRVREKYYDGQPFSADESWYEVKGYFDYLGNEIEKPFGHELVINTKKLDKHINSETFDNVLGFDVIYDGHPVSSNYKINTGDTPGKLIIRPITLNFYTDNGRISSDYTLSKTFDGTPLQGETIFWDQGSSVGVPYNWMIYPNNDNFITNVQFNGKSVTKVQNKCSYSIYIDGVLLNDDDLEKLIDNKNIEEVFETGYLKIEQFVVPYQTEKSIGKFGNIVEAYYWPGCEALEDSKIVYQFNDSSKEQEFEDLLEFLGATVKVDENSILKLSTLDDVTKKPKANELSLIVKNELLDIDYTKCFKFDPIESYLWLKKYSLTIDTEKSANGENTKTYDGKPISDHILKLSEDDLNRLTQLGISIEDIKVVGYDTFVDAGTHKNKLTITINGESIDDLFDVTYAQKDIVIKKKQIKLNIKGESKYFDNQILEIAKYEGTLTGDAIPYVFLADKEYIEANGFEFYLVIVNTFGPLAGKSDVEYTYLITKDGNDVRDNFDIKNNVIGNNAKFIINPYDLKIASVSDTQTYKEGLTYNKESLTAESLKVIETLESYGFVVTISWPDRVIDEIGEYENTFEVIVTYNGVVISNTNYKDSININPTFGKIIVNEKKVVPGTKPQDGEPSDNEPDNVEVFKVKSNQVGYLYLRGMSYGDYDGSKGFKEVNNAYNNYSSLNYNPYFSPASSLKSSMQKATVYIDMTAGKYNSYLYPYYSDLNPNNYDDTYISDNIGEVYAVDYYSYNNPHFINFPTSSIATEYSNYVYSQYTSLNGVNATLQYLLNYFISSNGLDPNDPEIIEKVKLAMTSFGSYDTSVDYSQSTDVVAEFLVTQKGVCRHYAKTATLIYRMLGIPARYTIGALVNIDRSSAQNGKYVSVKDGDLHAWVEVFVDGFGWVPVEVTKSKDKVDKDSKVTLMPALKEIQYYDGMEKVVLDEIEIETSSSEIYRVEGVISGSTNELGEHKTYIDSYKLYDIYGNDITKYYNVETKPGKLIIYHQKIEINVSSASKEYDGTALVSHDIVNKDSLNLQPGHRLNDLNLITFTNPGKTAVGVYTNSIEKVNLIVDELGNDVTDQYYIKINSGTLTISKRSIRITAESYDFTSEDTADVNGEYRHNGYKVVSGLMDGHTITNLEMDENSYVDGIDVFEALNKIDVDSIVIKDSEGNEVQKYYSFITSKGYLNYYED